MLGVWLFELSSKAKALLIPMCSSSLYHCLLQTLLNDYCPVEFQLIGFNLAGLFGRIVVLVELGFLSFLPQTHKTFSSFLLDFYYIFQVG